MTPKQWSRVFQAAAVKAAETNDVSLAAALGAMARECMAIDVETAVAGSTFTVTEAGDPDLFRALQRLQEPVRCGVRLTDGSTCVRTPHGPDTDHENEHGVSLERARVRDL